MAESKLITILMADDDPEDQMLVRDALEDGRLGNRLVCVNDGVELLAYLRGEGKYADRSAFPWPGLVLLDLNMPRMDGLEALQAIRSDPALRHMPVIVMTTSTEDRDVLASYHQGANTFVSKPVTFDKLIETLQSIEQYWFVIANLPPGPAAPKSAGRA